MVARKKVAGHKTAGRKRCGFVEGPYLARGWACCACYREHGVAIYNGAQSETCKQCGHARCAGALKRAWRGAEIAVPEAIGGLAGALLRAFGSFISPDEFKSRPPVQEPQEPQEDPKWQKACDEVTAAFAAARVHAEHEGRESKGPPPELLAKSVRTRLPRAVEIFGRHPANAPPCKCRHYCIVTAGAEQVSEMTGQPVDALAKSGIRIVDWYLATRS